jgi:hypothetical protein
MPRKADMGVPMTIKSWAAAQGANSESGELVHRNPSGNLTSGR